MSVFFNGRLLKTPTTASAVDDSAMQNTNPSVGNVLALVGKSAGGQPNVPLRFGSPTEAKAVLISGEMLKAVQKAFNPSNETGGPSEVVCVRVNPAVQATLTLKDAAANTVITLVSQDYGLWTNQIKVKLTAGSTKGLAATVQVGQSYATQDNLARNAFSIQYAGAAVSASMSITGSTVTLQAPSGTGVATIDLATYPTVAQLVDVINSTSGFTAAILDGQNGTTATLNALDTVTAQDVKTALYTATANLQAVVDWFNSQAEPYVTATRAANAGTVPAPINWTYLSGGSDGVTTNNEWSNAYTLLQTVDVQWVVPISPSASIWAMNDAHLQYMSTVGKQERRGIVGPAVGTTDAQALGYTLALNSDRTSLTHLGFYDYDDNGNLVLYPPYILAAQIAGAFSGVNPGTPMTNKSLTVQGMERALRNPTDTDALIDGGVLCVESTKTGYKVVKSISTWLTDDKYDKVEQSVGVALDYTVRSVREALDIYRGQKNSPQLLGKELATTETTLRQLAVPEPVGPEVLVGDKNSPPYKNITGSIEGDVTRIQFQCSPVLPNNYILVTVYAVPYSGSASL